MVCEKCKEQTTSRWLRDNKWVCSKCYTKNRKCPSCASTRINVSLKEGFSRLDCSKCGYVNKKVIN